jgi:hypothetical protein
MARNYKKENGTALKQARLKYFPDLTVAKLSTLIGIKPHDINNPEAVGCSREKRDERMEQYNQLKIDIAKSKKAATPQPVKRKLGRQPGKAKPVSKDKPSRNVSVRAALQTIVSELAAAPNGQQTLRELRDVVIRAMDEAS